MLNSALDDLVDQLPSKWLSFYLGFYFLKNTYSKIKNFIKKGFQKRLELQFKNACFSPLAMLFRLPCQLCWHAWREVLPVERDRESEVSPTGQHTIRASIGLLFVVDHTRVGLNAPQPCRRCVQACATYGLSDGRA